MRLFNKTIDRQLFKQYALGSDLSKQEVVAKIFNPMGAGNWFILNSDPQDPDYLWAIVDLGYGAEVGSVSRSELETYRGRFGMGFERDLSFDPVNAEELYNGLRQGKYYADGGGVENKPYIFFFYDENGNEQIFKTLAEATKEAKQQGQQKVRDNLGEEYFVQYADGGGVERNITGLNSLGEKVKDVKGLFYWKSNEDGKIRITSGNGSVYFLEFDTLPEAEAYVEKVNAQTPNFFSSTYAKGGGVDDYSDLYGQEVMALKNAKTQAKKTKYDYVVYQNEEGEISFARKNDFDRFFDKDKLDILYSVNSDGLAKNITAKTNPNGNSFDNVFLNYGFTKKRGAYGIRPYENKKFGTYAQIDDKTRSIEIETPDEQYKGGYSLTGVVNFLKSKGFEENGFYADGGEIKNKYKSYADFVKQNIGKDKFVITVGSGGTSQPLEGATEESINKQFKSLVFHNFKDYEFSLNYMPENLSAEYNSFVTKYYNYLIENPKEFVKFWNEFIVESGNYDAIYEIKSPIYDEHGNYIESREWIDNKWVKNHIPHYPDLIFSKYKKEMSPQLIKEYKEYLQEYAGDEIGYNFADGGNIADFSDNQLMIMNQNVEVEHHHEELEDILEDKVPVPAWVVAKMETATQNLSDITHYLDGQKELMEDENEDVEVRSSEFFPVDEENEDEDDDQEAIKNQMVVEPIDVTAGTKTELTKNFTDDALGNLRGFLKGMEGIDLRDDYTFDYRDEQFEVEPIINSDENGVSNAVFTFFDGDGEEVGEVAYSREGGKQKFTANSDYFEWRNAKFEDGGYFDGTIPSVSSYMSNYAKGGEVAKGEILGLKKNILGTTDVEMKITGMRKPQRFSVYPIGKDDTDKIITIQSETRIGKIDLSSGRGLMSQSHSNGAYFVHFQMDKLTPFTINEKDLKDITSHIFRTAGDNVGSRGIFSDNSGASGIYADGGVFNSIFPSGTEVVSGVYRTTIGIMAVTDVKNINGYDWHIITKLPYYEGGLITWAYAGKFKSGKLQKLNNYHHKVKGDPMIKLYEDKKEPIRNSEKKVMAQHLLALEIFKDKMEKHSFADGGFMNNVYADGGETEQGVDLFEDYENIPANLQEILDKYEDAFQDGEYSGLAKALKEANKIGYTFEYYLDGQAYDLRKIGEKGKSEVEDYAKGGKIKLGDIVEVKEPNYGYDSNYYVVDNKAGYDKDGFLISETRKRESSVFEEDQLKKLYAKGGMVVSSIKNIPNFTERLEQGKITYRGLGMGKLYDTFYDLAGTSGTRIKVDGKEYYITDKEFDTFSRGADGKLRVKFDAPFRRGYADGGFMENVYANGGGLGKKYYVIDAKDAKILSKVFDTEEEAKVEKYKIFEKTNNFFLTLKGVEDVRMKYAKKDIATLIKDGNMSMYDTKYGVIHLNYNNGEITIKNNKYDYQKEDYETIFKGGKDAGLFFIAEAYEVEEMAKGGSVKKDWWNTVVNPNEDFNNFDDKMPIDWDVDDFKSWVVSESDLDGNVDKAVLDVVKMPQSKLLVEYLNKNGSGKNNNEFYKEFGNWQSALYDIFTQMKKDYLFKKSLKYILKADIKTVTVNTKDGKEVTYSGADVLNGNYVLAKGGDIISKATYFGKNNVVEVELNDGSKIKPVNGYWVKKGAEPIGAEPTPTSSGNSEPKIGTTEIRKDMRGNWRAETNIDNFNGYDWRLSTIKTYSGNLVSSAQGGKTEATGSKGIKMFIYAMYQDPNHTLEVSKPKRLTDKVVTEQHEKALAKFKKFMETGMFKGGGKISNFDKLSSKVAEQYEGKPVKGKYQEEYGKYYSKEEAKEVGDKVAGKVKAMQSDEKAFGGFFGGAMKEKIIKKKYDDIEGKIVISKDGQYYKVIQQVDDKLLVINPNLLGTGVKPFNLNISEIEVSSYK